MNVNRPRLLIASLVVAVAVIGGYAWSLSGDDNAGDDAGDDTVVLEDPTDRDIEADDIGLRPNGLVNQLPDATVSDRDGNAITTASMLGDNPLVINFWFSSCAPCAKELPDFAEAHAEFGDEVRFIGVNTIDPIPAMERFADERGVTYELFRDDLAEFTDAIEASNFPITLFVTSDGTVIEQTGVIDLEGLRDKISTLQQQEELI